MANEYGIDQILANTGTVGGRSMASFFTPSTALSTTASLGAGLATAGIGAIPGIIGSFLSYFGMKEQNKLQKKALDQQMAMYNQQRQDANNQFDATLGENRRQFNQNYSLQSTEAANKNRLNTRQMDLIEKQLNANIADQKLAREQALQDKKDARKIQFLTNLTSFMNTPQVRQSILGNIKY